MLEEKPKRAPRVWGGAGLSLGNSALKGQAPFPSKTNLFWLNSCIFVEDHLTLCSNTTEEQSVFLKVLC